MNETVEQWNPTAINALLLLIGGGIAWLAKGGIEAYLKLREFRLQERLRIEAAAPPKKPFSTEQIWEDTQLGTGYKAMLYEWEKRVRQLEAGQVDLQAELRECHRLHAEADNRADAAEHRAKLAEERNTRLERKIAYLERRLGIANGNGNNPETNHNDPPSDIIEL